MDTPEPSRRGRRAVPLIAGSLAAVVVASLIYLHPASPSLPKPPAAPPSPSPATIPAGYSHQYDFISATTGWALLVGLSPPTRFYVYRTTDGAKHWTMQLSADAAIPGFGEVKFFDSKRGVIGIGSPVRLYRTSDGGTHWDPVPLPPYQVNLVTFSDPVHGWLLASERDQELLRHFLVTIDGGSTWTELAWPKGAAWANDGGAGHLQFRRPGEGWLAAAGAPEPTVYSTVDGGASWEPHALPTPSGPGLAVDTTVGLLPGVGVIAYTDYSLQGVAINSPPHTSFAYTSIDGGTTWRSVTLPADCPRGRSSPCPSLPLWTVTFQDTSHWWVASPDTVWESSDAGQSWQSVYQQLDNWVYQPQFVDVKHGWADLFVGTPGQASGLAMTSDGGLHWTQVNAPRPS
jgi:photosystem II stability/assembly factor-like uncharacterized protein